MGFEVSLGLQQILLQVVGPQRQDPPRLLVSLTPCLRHLYTCDIRLCTPFQHDRFSSQALNCPMCSRSCFFAFSLERHEHSLLVLMCVNCVALDIMPTWVWVYYYPQMDTRDRSKTSHGRCGHVWDGDFGVPSACSCTLLQQPQPTSQPVLVPPWLPPPLPATTRLTMKSRPGQLN